LNGDFDNSRSLGEPMLFFIFSFFELLPMSMTLFEKSRVNPLGFDLATSGFFDTGS